MKLLLAEDTRDLNRAVRAILEYEHYSVDSAFDGEEAMEYLKRERYDGVILDIMMPKKDGLQVLAELRERGIRTPVLLLTARAEIDDRVAGLDAGADDYLPKPFAMKELLARLRSLLRRQGEFGPGTLQFEDVSLDTERFALAAENAVRLSIREYELMYALMTNTDLELTTTYLLEHIWKSDPSAQDDTVWLYICYLKDKLRAVGSPVTITGQKGGGFRLVGGLRGTGADV